MKTKQTNRLAIAAIFAVASIALITVAVWSTVSMNAFANNESADEAVIAEATINDSETEFVEQETAVEADGEAEAIEQEASAEAVNADEIEIGFLFSGLDAGAALEIEATHNKNPYDYKIGDKVKMTPNVSFWFYYSGDSPVLEFSDAENQAWKFVFNAPFEYILKNCVRPEASPITESFNFEFVYTKNVLEYTLYAQVNTIDPESEEEIPVEGVEFSFISQRGTKFGPQISDELGWVKIENIPAEDAIGTIFGKAEGYTDVFQPIDADTYKAGVVGYVSLDTRALTGYNFMVDSIDPNHQYFHMLMFEDDEETTWQKFEECNIPRFYKKIEAPSANITIFDTEENYGSLWINMMDVNAFQFDAVAGENYRVKSWDILSPEGLVGTYYPGDSFSLEQDDIFHIQVNYEPIPDPTPAEEQVAGSAQTGDPVSAAIPFAVLAVAGLVFYRSITTRKNN